MMRLADALARDLNCRALVTGESLGQVASQTMDALAVSGDVTDLPVLRPVIGMDKEEIVRIARHIGTFETSILPYEDCCTVFPPAIPKPAPMWRRSARWSRPWTWRAWSAGPWRAGKWSSSAEPCAACGSAVRADRAIRPHKTPPADPL